MWWTAVAPGTAKCQSAAGRLPGSFTRSGARHGRHSHFLEQPGRAVDLVHGPEDEATIDMNAAGAVRMGPPNPR